MINRIVLNETAYFGRASREKIKDELIKRNHKKVLVVTDYNLVDSNITEKVTNELDKINIQYYVFMNVQPNPTIENVKNGLTMAQINNVDALVAIGGGSVIDTAKAISIIMTNPEYSDVRSLEGLANTKNKGLPLFALPTTAGTAAEATINYVITDEDNMKKMVCVDVNDIPVCSIVDPDLMETMPPILAASTGIDALTHAIEGYITKSGWLIPDMFHINAMALLYKNLSKAVNEKDKVAIEKVAYAQYIAGMGFSNVGLGITHSMAHSLGAYFDTPHGIANAILLPHVLRFNGKSCPDLMKNIAIAFNLDFNSNENETDIVVKAIEELIAKLHIPTKLKDVGVSYDMLPTLAIQALNDPCTGGNPRSVTSDEILEIYKQAY